MSKTIIKYIVTGMRTYDVPIITIIPKQDISIKITFPNMDDINIETNSNIVITQKEDEPYPTMNLVANDKIIAVNRGFFTNGTIIITGDCSYEETTYSFCDM